MAKGIREIRRRIKSIKATKQVTRAMQMVSAVKMRKAQEAGLKRRAHIRRLTSLFLEIRARHPKLTHPFLEKGEKGRTLTVLVTSSRGLAGGLNANVIRAFWEYMKVDEDARQGDVITIGRKGYLDLTRAGRAVVADFSDLSDNATFLETATLIMFLRDTFADGTYNRANLVSTHFYSTLRQQPIVKELLPLGDALERFHTEAYGDLMTATRELPGNMEFLLEPTPQAVFDEIIPRLVEFEIFQSILEAQAAEHSARMLAMKNATDAASDLIDDLTFSANQLRQASITQEIAEITAGVAALS